MPDLQSPSELPSPEAINVFHQTGNCQVPLLQQEQPGRLRGRGPNFIGKWRARTNCKHFWGFRWMILMTLVGSWMFCCNRACWLLLKAPQPSPKVLLWVAETSQLNPFQSHPRMPALWNKTTWIYLGHQWQCCYITNIPSGNLRICYGSHDPFVFIFSAFNMLIIYNTYWLLYYYINHILIDSWFNLNCQIPELPETIFITHPVPSPPAISSQVAQAGATCKLPPQFEWPWPVAKLSNSWAPTFYDTWWHVDSRDSLWRPIGFDLTLHFSFEGPIIKPIWCKHHNKNPNISIN